MTRKMAGAAANLHLTFHKPNPDFEELYSLVSGLPPNTHIVPSRHADRGTHLPIKMCTLSELLTVIVS